MQGWSCSANTIHKLTRSTRLYIRLRGAPLDIQGGAMEVLVGQCWGVLAPPKAAKLFPFFITEGRRLWSVFYISMHFLQLSWVGQFFFVTHQLGKVFFFCYSSAGQSFFFFYSSGGWFSIFYLSGRTGRWSFFCFFSSKRVPPPLDIKWCAP